MEKSRLQQLLTEYSTSTINQSDMEELLDYVANHHRDADLDSLLEEMLEETDLGADLQVDSEGLYQRIVEHPRFWKQLLGVKKRQWWLYGTAAAVLLFIMGGLFLKRVMDVGELDASKTTPSLANRTATTTPSDRPVLQLANGRLIYLDSAANGILAVEDGIQIVLDGKSLQYEGELVDANGATMRNTIITPKGRQYQLVLPDGSRIWLNAATTLTYPVKFGQDKREVEVSGEAYFEVERAEDWPFVVKTTTQQIAVLGTHFNVSAYEDDQRAKTTLVEGRVRVALLSPDGQSITREKVLEPGQQAVTSKGSDHLEIGVIDTEEVRSWKENLFVFNNEEIGEVMRKVSRWYDVEVEYLDGMAGKRIGGTIPKFEHVEELMDALRATGLLHYKMEGGVITVME